jgi:hypothetical protein
MRKVLILSFSDLSTDPRVNRQISIFSKVYKVYAAGYNCPKLEGITFINLIPKFNSVLKKIGKLLLLISQQFHSGYWDSRIVNHIERIKSGLGTSTLDLIYANDISSLPLALKLGRSYQCKVIFDAHEYSPREWEDKLTWRLTYQPYITYLCKTYISQADLVITVGQRIADEYQNQFGIDKVHVILNAPPQQKELNPSNIDPSNIRLIHHGAAIKSRKLERMIEMMDHLDDCYSLDLMLVPSDVNYLNGIKKKAKSKKVTFIEPVPMEDIAKKINEYDIGVYILDESNNFNNQNAMPNKFFEFIQAALAIAIAPSPEMKLLVEKYGLGVVAKSFDSKSLAKKINELTVSKLKQFKSNAKQAAEILNAENEGEKLLKLVESLLDIKPCVA